MGSENDGGPAFPSGDGVHAAGPCHHYGITVREYAAIHLRVPNSGTDWLDEMIRESQRDVLAGQAMDAMVGLCSETNRDTRQPERNNDCVGAMDFTRPNMDEIWSDLNTDEPSYGGSAIANAAYGFADAMLAARKATNEAPK